MSTTYKLNDKVYMVGNRPYSRYQAGVVVKVTPKGFVDVQADRPDGCGPTTRFNDRGRSIGLASYDEMTLDRIPFDERTAMIATAHRTVVAAGLLRKVCADTPAYSGRCNEHWGKDGLVREVARLQALLDEAKAAVEAI